MIVDIGPQTRMSFTMRYLKLKFVMEWSLGLFEKKPFDEGTCFVLMQ